MTTTRKTPLSERFRGSREWYFLEERHEAMLVGRAVALVAIGVTAAFVPRSATDLEHLRASLACAAALLLHVALWAMARRWPRRLLASVDAALVVDAALILALTDLTASADGIGLWLLPLLALAVTLGYSTWYGVKALLLGGIVLGSVYLLEETGAPPLEQAAAPLVIAAAIVVVAGVFNGVNERDLDRRIARLDAKWSASAALTAASEAEEVLSIVRPAFAAQLAGWSVSAGLGGGEAVARTWRDGRRAVLEVPMVSPADGRVLGRLTATRTRTRFSRVRVWRRQMDALGEIAADAATALARIREVDRLERLSLADALTGLGNRRAFDEAISSELSRAGRTGAPLGLVMIDVDHFKRFNDRHGHQAGDTALVTVAGAIARAARAEDRACRVGGEEFALLLPGADEAAAGIVAERVRAGIEAASDIAEPVTVSVGVASARGGDPHDLVGAADERLYAAKKAGRNRVVAADVG